MTSLVRVGRLFVFLLMLQWLVYCGYINTKQGWSF